MLSRRMSVCFGLFCLLVLLGHSGACVISDAGPCTTTDDCKKYTAPLLCARGWCVPKYIFDMVQAKDAQRDASEPLADEPSADEPLPEVAGDEGGTPEQPIETPPVDKKSCRDDCSGGEVADCFPQGTQGCVEKDKTCQGTCSLGQKQCVVGADGCLVWGQCLGAGLPTSEVCDGKDNDCNGKIDDDEKCKCVPGAKQECGSDVGVCKKGTQFCDQQGQWDVCNGETKPSVEVCDGVDNDCNGKIDEVLLRPCYTGPAGTVGVGICRGGTETCEAGKWSACKGEQLPETEKCDGIDNDCTGTPDEGCACKPGDKQPCGIDTGACEKGTQYCTSQGQWDKCIGETLPTTESCNNMDDDCDGKIDGIQRSCYTGAAGTVGKGPCVAGIETCTAGQWGACVGEVVNAPKEICRNQIDDNCDGKVDEDCHWGAVIAATSATDVLLGKSHIGVDGAGNVYVAGTFTGTLKLGTITLTSVGGFNGFVAKIDKSGAFVWAKLLGGATTAATNRMEIRDLVADSSGNAYITGWIEGSFKIGANTHTISGASAGFVAKLDTTGAFAWFKPFGGSQITVCRTSSEALAIDSKGILYVAGYSASGFVLDAASVSPGNYCEQTAVAFVMQLDSSGKGLKASNSDYVSGTYSYSYARKIAVDSTGNAIICGELDSGKVKFGSTTLDPMNSSSNFFIAKVSVSGSFSWAFALGNGSQDAFCQGLTVDSSGNTLLVVAFEGAVSLGGKALTRTANGMAAIHLDPAGKILWDSFIDPNGSLNCSEVAINSAGNPHFVGWFSDTVKFGQTTVTVKGREVFVAELSAAGQYQSHAISTSTNSTTRGDAIGHDIAFDADGHSYISGEFASPVKIGIVNLSATGLTSFFVVKNLK